MQRRFCASVLSVLMLLLFDVEASAQAFVPTGRETLRYVARFRRLGAACTDYSGNPVHENLPGASGVKETGGWGT